MHANKKTHQPSLRAFMAAILLMLILVGGVERSQAQQGASTDSANPTPITGNVISGVGVNEKTEYFYSFAATPGTVKVLLEVTADRKAAVSSVDLAVVDADGNSLLSTYANPDHGSSKHSAQTMSVKTPQTLLLQVTVSPGVNTFKISLSGSVNIQPATGTDAPDSSAPAAASSDSSTIDQNIQNKLSQPPGPQVIEGTTVNKKTLRTFEFSAGPGDVSLKLDVKSLPNAAVSSVDIELLNSNQTEIAAGFANPSFGASKQTIVNAHLPQKQTLTLKVIVSPGVNNYTLTVSGAVNNYLDEAGFTARLPRNHFTDMRSWAK